MSHEEEIAQLKAELREQQQENRRLREMLASGGTQPERILRLLMAAVEQNQDGYAITDLNGRIIHINAANAALHGVTPAQAVGMSVFDFAPAEEHALYRRIMHEVQQSGFWRGEVLVRRADGSTFPAFFQAKLLTDRHGDPLALLGVTRDITAQKAAEDRLRASEAKLRALLNAMSDVVLVLDREGRYLYIAPTSPELLLKPAPDLLGRTLHQVFPPEMADAFLGCIREALETGQTISATYSLTIDARQVWFDAAISPLEDGTVVWVARDVTERAHAEERLRESEQKYRSLIEEINDWVWEVDEHTVYTYASPRVRDLLGYEPEEVVGKTPFDLMPPGEGERVAAAFAPIAARREPFALLQHSMVRRDGQLIAVETSGFPIVTADGRFAGYRGIDRDVTSRLQVEAALHASEERLKQLVQTVPDGIIITDNSGKITFANPSAEKILGLPQSGFLERTYNDQRWQITDAEGGAFPDHKLPFVRARETGKPVYGVEYAVVRPDGVRIVLALNAAPLHDDAGNITGTVAAFTDITVRRRMEDELERERAFLSSAIELLPFPIAFLSPKGQLLRTNKASQAVLDGETELGAWAEVAYLTPDTRTPIPDEEMPGRRALQGKIAPSREVVVRFPDGREMPALVFGAPVYVGGKVAAAVVAVQDISQLKEADRAKDQFLAVLSHELLTPLTSILGWTQAAKASTAIVPQALDTIERNAKRQERILNDLLDISRILYGRLLLKRTRTDLWEQVTQSVHQYADEAQEKRITVTMEPPSEPLTVNADPARLRQAMSNLISNALKFNAAGGSVIISGLREGDMAVVTVRDTGRGMTAEQVANVFSPFRQYDRDERIGGLGLGLALTRGIIELQNGRVSAASPGPGHGSTFTIRLPLVS